MTSADAIVVGGGPAGSAAAIRALGAGLGVVVLERQTLPRQRAGETLHPGVESPLRMLGVLDRVEDAGFVRHEGVWQSGATGEHFVPYGRDADGPWRGYQAFRPRFDALLADRVRELGGRFLTGTRALRPLLAGGRVAGVETHSGPISAPVVIDAAGGGHWLARRLGLAIERHCPRLVAAYGYLEGDAPAGRDAPLFQMGDSGWTWLARVRLGTYAWARLELEPDRGAQPPFTGRAADVTWRRVAEPVGPGYVLAGDAAAVVDPASSHGVLRALLGGIAAGDVASGGATGAAYRRWVRDGFDRDTHALRTLYRELPRPPTWLCSPAPQTAAAASSGPTRFPGGGSTRPLPFQSR